MTRPIRLLIADDHPVVRDGLRAMLSTQPDLEVIAEATTGTEAVARARALRPDVVLMDLQMPQLDGADAIAALRSYESDVHVLVLTTYDTDADITRAIDAGATGYLLKDAPRDQLFAAIRSAAKGESALSPSVASRVLGRMRAPAEEALSPREIDILSVVARGLSNKDIGRRLHISEATVKTHLLRIFAKLGVGDRTAAAPPRSNAASSACRPSKPDKARVDAVAAGVKPVGL
jgi:DNA-binding NarL/FixJ family response regulator